MRSNVRGSALALLVVVSVVAAVGVAATPAVADDDGTATQACSFPFSKTDATGTEVTVRGEPDSVVTLAPSAAQTMWEIGAKDKVVGVTKYASYLDGAGQKTNISGSGFTSVVQEKVIALNPNVVLAPNVVQDKVVESLREVGLTVYKFRASETLDDIVAKTRLTGKLVGECEGADARADRMAEDVQLIRETVEGEDRPTVLYEFSNGYTAGSKTFIGEMIATAGGTNVAGEAGIEYYQTISSETVADQDPEFLIQSTRSPDPPDSDAYQGTTAVQEDNVVVINVDYLNQPAPRTVTAVKKMVQAFHPEAYEASLATPTPTPTETPAGTMDTATDTTMPSGDDGETATDGGTATETSSESAPGFGSVAALVAVAAVALLGRRR